MLRFSYGDRNGDTDISANASHIISSRTSVNASFTESIQTSQSLISQQLLNINNLGLGTPLFLDANNNLTTTPTLVPATIGNRQLFSRQLTQFGLSESTFRQQVFRLGFTGSRRRNTFSGGGFWEERNTESTGITETTYGANLSVGRQLSSRLNGSVGLTVDKTDFGTADKREEIEYSGSASIGYQVRNDLQATLAYNLTLRKVNNAPDDLLENAVSLTLTKSF